MKKLQITKGEAFTDGWHIMVDRKNLHTGLGYNRQIASVENAGTDEAESNARLYVDAHNTYLSNPIIPSELLRQNREMKEALAEIESALKWYMENTTPNNNDMQTFHDLGMNARANAVNCLISLNKGKE